jgi:hypothetical protein
MKKTYILLDELNGELLDPQVFYTLEETEIAYLEMVNEQMETDFKTYKQANDFMQDTYLEDRNYMIHFWIL